jgi:signal transduction histidine kinase
MKFEQTKSIVRRFRWLTVALGLFLLVESAGTFFSSHAFLNGLKNLSQINSVTDFSARAVDNVSSAQDVLNRIAENPITDVRTVLPAYAESEKQALQAIDSALQASPSSERVNHLLRDARTSVEELNRAALKIFKMMPAKHARARARLQQHLLLVKQFNLDASESLRGAQIELSKMGNEIFSSVYHERFTPLLVSLFLAVGFFAAVLALGFSTTKKLNQSLGNLLEATDRVANGDLTASVAILSPDEIGRLTFAFNSMVSSLEQSMSDVRKAIHMRDEFLSIASHELKTPITSLKLQLQVAQRQIKPEQGIVPEAKKLARVFEISITQVERLTLLVDDLLDVGRIEAGKFTLDLEETNLAAVVRNVAERFADALDAAKCKIELKLSELVLVHCDPFRIEQVVINILSNAMKYSPGQLIEVSIQEEPQQVVLVIRDHGPGIPPDKQALIFDRFERGSAHQNVGGLGLGLYISKQIVDAHGGKISVESELGHGSTFRVKLPRVSKSG